MADFLNPIQVHTIVKKLNLMFRPFCGPNGATGEQEYILRGSGKSTAWKYQVQQ